MPRPRKTTLVSFQHAFDGIRHVVRTQRRMQVNLVLAALVIAAGAWVRLAREQWFVIYFALTLVFLSEMMSTAIAACVDLYAEKYQPAASRARQIAAGASLAARILAAISIALIFMNPPL